MKRILLVGAAVALGTGTLLFGSAPAWAHVVVGPEEVTAGDYETLTVSVPTEKEVPTTEVRVEVPDGFTLSGVQPVPGWEHDFEEKGGLIRAVTWSGGEIGPQEFQQFLVQAQAPDEPGEYAWKAFQTYKDGSVVEWTGPADAEEPASIVAVVAGGGAEGHADEGGAADEHGGTDADTLAQTGGTNVLLYAGLGIGALAVGGLLLRRLLAS